MKKQEIIIVVNSFKDITKYLKDTAAILPAKNVPAHIVFRNRVKPEDLAQSINKSMTDKSFETAVVGNIAEIIADYKADINNNELDKSTVIRHYRAYRELADKFKNSVSQNIRSKFDEMQRVIPLN